MKIVAGDAEAIALRVVEGEKVTVDEVRILAAFVLVKDLRRPRPSPLEFASDSPEPGVIRKRDLETQKWVEFSWVSGGVSWRKPGQSKWAGRVTDYIAEKCGTTLAALRAELEGGEDGKQS